MNRDALDLLLKDAQEQYKAEIDRAGQVYTRCGIYLAVLAVYVGALARFLDKPPVRNSSVALSLFVLGTIVLIVATVLTLLFTLCALWGRTVTYTLLPHDWIEYVDAVEPWFKQAAQTGYIASVEEDVKERMLKRFAEATRRNYLIRTTRFGFCHRASQLLAVGFVGLLVSVGSYSYLAVETLDSNPVTSVRVVDPVEIRDYKRLMSESGPSRQSGAPVTSPVPAGRRGGSGETQPRPPSSSADLPPKPEPRDVRTVNDGEVRSRVLKD